MLGRPQAAQLIIIWGTLRPDKCPLIKKRRLAATISAATAADVEALDTSDSLPGTIEPVTRAADQRNCHQTFHLVSSCSMSQWRLSALQQSGCFDALELLQGAECGADQLELLLVLLEGRRQGA